MSPVLRGLWTGVALVLLIGLAPIESHAFGKKANPNFPKLLSYSQLMNLTPHKREMYIQGVRKLLAEVAQTSYQQRANFFADNRSDYNSYMALLEALLPEARADEKLAPGLSMILPDTSGASAVCDPKNSIVPQGVFDLNTNTRGMYGRTENTRNESCPEGFIPVEQQPLTGTFSCATSASYWNLPPVLRNKVRSVTNQKDSDIVKAFSAEPAALAETKCEEPLITFEFFKRENRGIKSKGCVLSEIHGDTKCPEDFVGVDQRADGRFTCVSKETFERLSPVDQAKLRASYKGETPGNAEEKAKFGPRTVNFINSNGQQAKAAAGDDKKDGETKIGGESAGGAAGQCAPLEVECKKATSGEEYRQFRDAFYKSNIPHICIYSGNISRYYGPRKAPGQCAPVVGMQIGDSKEEGNGLWTCNEGKGETLCNPLIFGVKKDSHEAFCVSRRTVNGVGPTEACDKMSTRETSATDFLDWKLAGIQEKWNAFRTGFNSLCKEDEAARNFHCAECHVLAKRLREVNKLVYGNCDGPGDSSPGNSKPGEGPANPAPAAPARRSTGTA